MLALLLYRLLLNLARTGSQLQLHKQSTTADKQQDTVGLTVCCWDQRRLSQLWCWYKLCYCKHRELIGTVVFTSKLLHWVCYNWEINGHAWLEQEKASGNLFSSAIWHEIISQRQEGLNKWAAISAELIFPLTCDLCVECNLSMTVMPEAINNRSHKDPIHFLSHSHWPYLHDSTVPSFAISLLTNCWQKGIEHPAHEMIYAKRQTMKSAAEQHIYTSVRYQDMSSWHRVLLYIILSEVCAFM